MNRHDAPDALLLAVAARVDDFLHKWTRTMNEAGYLQSTTAKTEDCILSFQWFLEPLLRRIREARELESFPELLRNTEGWADPILATADRHRFRGVTAEMFVGCFKTLVHSVEEMVLEEDAPPWVHADALALLRRLADAGETLIVRQWTALPPRESEERCFASNRLLTLEKNKYENILSVISDLVLIVNQEGAVVEFNQATRGYFSPEELGGRPVWEVLGLEAQSMAEVLAYYPSEHAHELAASDESVFFECRIVPLKQVSLASGGYLVVLKDITPHVTHRATLEQRVRERTAAVEREKRQLEEMNITLRHVMRSVDRELDEHKRCIDKAVSQVLMPALAKVRQEDCAAVRQGYVDVLEDQLLQLSSGRETGGNPLLLKLTPMEMKVCQFVQAGSSTKAIAEALNLSMGTVQTHRKNIRRKLKLQHRDINLQTFLAAPQPREEHDRQPRTDLPDS